jgi:hypothetical protein
VVNNVETIAAIPDILELGGDRWCKLGKLPGDGGLRCTVVLELGPHASDAGFELASRRRGLVDVGPEGGEVDGLGGVRE